MHSFMGGGIGLVSLYNCEIVFTLVGLLCSDSKGVIEVGSGSCTSLSSSSYSE